MEHKLGKFQKLRVITPCFSAISINTILLLELINDDNYDYLKENATILSQFLLSNSASDELCNYKHSDLQPRERSNCSRTEPKFQLQKFRTIEEIGCLSVGSYGMTISAQLAWIDAVVQPDTLPNYTIASQLYLSDGATIA